MRRRGPDLGHPVALQHRAAEAIGEGAQRLRRQRCPADVGDPQSWDARLRLGRLQQRLAHGRDAEEDAGLLALHRLERGRGLEARHQGDARPARDCGVHHPRLAEDVREGRRAEDDVVGCQAQHLPAEEACVGPEPLVRQLRSLRPAARPGGVEQDRRVSGFTARDLDDRLGPVGSCRVDELRPHSLQLAGSVDRSDEHGRSGVRDSALDLGAAQQRVERHDDRAEAKGAVVGADEGRLVRKQHCHPVAGHDPLRAEQAGEARRARIELVVGDRLALVQQGRPLAVGASGVCEQIGEVCHQPRR